MAQQTTKGVVTSKISISKASLPSIKQIVDDYSKKSGVKILNTKVTAEGMDVITSYGPVWGGQEYDIRQKMAASIRKFGFTGQVTYDSKRLVVETR